MARTQTRNPNLKLDGQNPEQSLDQNLGEELASATATIADDVGAKSQNWVDQIQGGVTTARQTLRNSRETAANIDRKFRGQVKRNPVILLAGAMGTGYLLGSRLFNVVPKVLMLIGAKTVISELSSRGVFASIEPSKTFKDSTN